MRGASGAVLPVEAGRGRWMLPVRMSLPGTAAASRSGSAVPHWLQT